MIRTPARARLDHCLERIADASGEGARAFTRLYPEEARIAAAASDARAKFGRLLGPLDGRIVSIKDLFDVAGEPTTAGSVVYREAPAPEREAEIVRRLRAAGAVIVGKTNMTEFAFSGIGLNPHYGTPLNPRDRSRIPGGSSSGAAVATADGFCEIAIGTDTGGSVRIPAAFCRLVGFKPTQFRVPRDGAMALSTTLDSIGPLAVSVADAALTDAVMAGETPRPPVARQPATLSLAMPLGRLFEKLDADVTAAFENAVKALLDAGVRIIDYDLEPLLARLDAINAIASISAVEAACIHADVLRDRADDIDRRVVARIRGGSNIAAPLYVQMLQMRRAVADLARAEFDGFDALVLPTVPTVAPAVAPLEASDAAFSAANMLTLRNTTIFNMLDCCAISLPIPSDGLPVGLMLVGAHGTDRRLLDVAAGIEALFQTG
ncbi:MAG: amidase [Methylobacteriaceae bacterium]|nr:amidase [Methylobacteriaceae bacterium]